MRTVKVINQIALEQAVRRYRDAGSWLAKWHQITTSSTWESLQDVRRVFPSADGVNVKTGIVVTVFNVKGNHYRLLTFIDYTRHTVFVISVLTHAEYDKNQWKQKP